MLELTTGDSFGEAELTQKGLQIATVTTINPTEVVVLDKTTYDNVIKVSNINKLIV